MAETKTEEKICWICSEQVKNPDERLDSIDFMGVRYWFCCSQHRKQFESEYFT